MHKQDSFAFWKKLLAYLEILQFVVNVQWTIHVHVGEPRDEQPQETVASLGKGASLCEAQALGT